MEYITKSDTVKCVGDIFVIQTVLRFVLSIVQIVLILGHSNVSGRFRSWKISNNPRLVVMVPKIPMKIKPFGPFIPSDSVSNEHITEEWVEWPLLSIFSR